MSDGRLALAAIMQRLVEVDGWKWTANFDVIEKDLAFAESLAREVEELREALRYAPTPEFVQRDYSHKRLSFNSPYIYATWYLSFNSPYIYATWYDGPRRAALSEPTEGE